MNQSINTDSKNSKEPQQKYRLGTVSIKILGGLNRFYRRLTSPSASIMAQNIHKPDRQIFKIFGIKPKVFMRIIILSDLFESRVALNPGIGDVMGVENTFHCLV